MTEVDIPARVTRALLGEFEIGDRILYATVRGEIVEAMHPMYLVRLDCADGECFWVGATVLTHELA